MMALLSIGVLVAVGVWLYVTGKQGEAKALWHDDIAFQRNRGGG